MNTKINAEVEVLKHTDVKGKELLYLKISNKNGVVLINIGEKTFKNIEALGVEQQEIKFEDPEVGITNNPKPIKHEMGNKKGTN